MKAMEKVTKTTTCISESEMVQCTILVMNESVNLLSFSILMLSDNKKKLIYALLYNTSLSCGVRTTNSKCLCPLSV